MILSVRIGDVESMIDTEDPAFVPDVAASLLDRLTDAVLKMYAAMPDAAPTSDE